MDTYAIYEGACRIFAARYTTADACRGIRAADAAKVCVREATALWFAALEEGRETAATSRTPGADRAITPTAAQAAGAV